MKVFRQGTKEFEQALEAVVRRFSEEGLEQVEAEVKKILAEVRTRGDEALLAYTETLDGVRLSSRELQIPPARLDQALAGLDGETREALLLAHDRIREFHARQPPTSWEMEDSEGNLLGQKVTPIDRVGVYVPGGKAAYPSTVLMNVVPAKTAGVREIVIVTPPGRARENQAILAAAKIAGVDTVYQVGGAQAIGALAYGTETIRVVDKIVGPGNIYVTTAKRLVFGQVDIDMTAGPSEVLVVADRGADPMHLAADLLAQAEHDERAVPMLVTTSESLLSEVLAELEKQLCEGPWEGMAKQAIERNGKAFLVQTLTEAIDLANRIAPEHLELAIQGAGEYLPQVRHAGAVFLGANSAETLGDYVAGPNHVLPTMGTARFFSPLGAYDFVKRSNFLRISEPGLGRLGPAAIRLARLEGLFAHARSLEVRLRERPCFAAASFPTRKEPGHGSEGS